MVSRLLDIDSTLSPLREELCKIVSPCTSRKRIAVISYLFFLNPSCKTLSKMISSTSYLMPLASNLLILNHSCLFPEPSFEVLAAVQLKILFFCYLTLRHCVVGSRRFGETFCVYLQYSTIPRVIRPRKYRWF